MWPHLAVQEGDVIHQKQDTVTVKCWKDIQSLPLCGDEREPKKLQLLFCRIDICSKLV